MRRCPSPGCPSSRAASRGSATRVSRVRLVRVWGPSTCATACALAGRCCAPWGWRKGVPGGGTFLGCEGRLRSGAPLLPAARPPGGLSRSTTDVPWMRLVRAWGLSTVPTACALAGQRCSLWGWRKGIPGGGAFRRCEGRLRSGAPPPQTARPPGGLSGSARHRLWARVCGCGGPALSPWLACPVGAVCCGAGGGLSPGGVACHRCEGHLVSGAVPPPAACPLGRPAGVPRPACPGCGWCGRGDPAPALPRAPLRAGVVHCGGGGRASPGGGAFAVVRGV